MVLFEQRAEAFSDPQLPIIFHYDTVNSSTNFIRLHWHESPELLFFTEGEALVTSDSEHETLHPGEVAFINCSNLHMISAVTPIIHYYCIIISREFCENLGILVGETQFKLRIDDERAKKIIDNIINELTEKTPLYKDAVKAKLWELLILFCREFTDARPETKAETKKKTTVKNAINYMQNHLSEPLTVDEISEKVGFSKYYFCRVFREITGSSVIDYLNLIRCRNAKRLLLSGQYNVCESAEQSGYTNLSYFSRCYRRYAGELPSRTIKR